MDCCCSIAGSYKLSIALCPRTVWHIGMPAAAALVAVVTSGGAAAVVVAIVAAAAALVAAVATAAADSFDITRW